jgi:hypothetical protein
MTSVPGQSDVTAAPRRTIFEAHTGAGRPLKVEEVGDWLDVTFLDRDGKRAGFSVNPLFTAHLTMALVEVVAGRSTRPVLLEDAQQRADEAERALAVMREGAARLKPLARRAVTEGGASGDQARADLREAIDHLRELGRTL